jgi:chloramphenicol 3-O phosphotransferase
VTVNTDRLERMHMTNRANERPQKWPDVILVNGPSSAGKTTLCRGLQQSIAHTYLCVGVDDFVFFAPSRYYRGADTAEQKQQDSFTSAGVRMVVRSTTGEPRSVEAVFGPVFRNLIEGMAPSVRALIDAGNSVIFDHVLHDRDMYESVQRAFAGLHVFTAGVVCPVEILEAREASRGDRVRGRARGPVQVVHSFCEYDILVNTGEHSPQECVDQVLGVLTSRLSQD